MKWLMRWVQKYGGWVVIGVFVGGAGLWGWHLSQLGYARLQVDLAPTDTRWQLGAATVSAARVQIRGEPQTPNNGGWFRLRPGAVKVAVELTHFHPWETNVVLTKGATSSVPVLLVPEPQTLTISNLPPGCVVTVGGRAFRPEGTVFSLPNVPVGPPVTVQLNAPTYRPKESQVTLARPGQGWVVADPGLERMRGDIAVHVVPLLAGQAANPEPYLREVKVSLDGESVADWKTLKGVTAGEHRLTASHPAFRDGMAVVEVTDRGTTEATINLRPRPAVIELQVSPEPFQVEDVTTQPTAQRGRVLTPTEHKLELEPQEATLLLFAEGYVPERRTFQLEPNGRYTWAASLEHQDAVPYAKARAALEELLTKENRRLLSTKAGTNLVAEADLLLDSQPNAPERYREETARAESLSRRLRQALAVEQKRLASVATISELIQKADFTLAATSLNQHSTEFGADGDYERLRANLNAARQQYDKAQREKERQAALARLRKLIEAKDHAGASAALARYIESHGQDPDSEDLARLLPPPPPPPPAAKAVLSIVRQGATGTYEVFLNGQSYESLKPGQRELKIELTAGSYHLRVDRHTADRRTKTVADETLQVRPGEKRIYRLVP